MQVTKKVNDALPGNRFANLLRSLVQLAQNVWLFYYDGFRNMTVGKKLWTIILIKLFIMFAILKVFFFPNLLERDYDNDNDRAAHVRQELTHRQ